MPRLPAIRPSSGPNRTPTRTQGERPSTFGQADSAIQSLSNTVQAAIVKHERQREANALYAAETEAQSKLAEVKRQALEDPASAVNTYTNQSQAVRDEVLAGIDDNRVREEFQLRYDRDHARGLAVVRNRSIKALRQENIAAATSQAEDIAVNSAELGGKARETMIDEGMAAYKRLLDTGDIDQAEFEDKALEFKARADDQRARYLIRNGELDAATSLIGQSDALDETAKLTLQNSVDVRKRREQAKTEQAARDAERAILTPGGFVPEGTESLVNALKGTEAGDALEQAIADRQLIDETVRKPLAEQFAVVTRLRREAREARDPVQLQTAKNVAKAVKNSFDMADDDPLAYAASVGHVDLDPIFDDSGQLDTEAVHDRLLAAREATRKTGKRTLPFTQPEISALNKTMTEGEASQAVLTMQELATALPPSTHFQVANALLPENRSTAVAFGLAKDQPRMAAAVLEGRDILAQDNSLVELPSAADLQDAAATVYEDMFAGQPGTFDAHIQAAKQLYAKRAADSGAFSYDKSGFKQALRDVVNGQQTARGAVSTAIPRYNGPTIPPERGMSGSDLEELVSGLRDDDLAKYGNGEPVADTGDRITALDLQEARLIRHSSGSYLISFGDYPRSFAKIAGSNEPYLLDLRAAWDDGVADRDGSTIRAPAISRRLN